VVVTVNGRPIDLRAPLRCHTPTHHQKALLERFVDLFKELRAALPAEKARLEAGLTTVIDELRKSLQLDSQIKKKGTH